MTSFPGAHSTRIGPYRIDREIARGGMGVVYLAHDTRLGRTVALKALPEEVASDPDRLDRFEREAKLLASLNHPNIGAIYDVVQSDGRWYLALEHIEGETLAQRLSGDALPVSESMDICYQIAAGMEAAHEGGVVHRDLKPGNLMITPGGQVKILDFGLAKGGVARGSSQVDSPTVTASSPTITSPAYSPGTIPGVILGTAPYLSPEQARGKPVDRRTDIWSWGCVLYECLTGRMAFHGETVSDTIAAILNQEPDWSRLPREAPSRLRELLRRCLVKDPNWRLRDIGEARVAIQAMKSQGGSPPLEALEGRRSDSRTRAGWRRAVFAVSAIAVFLALAAAWALQRAGNYGPSPSPPVVRSTIEVPLEFQGNEGGISPDGRFLIVPGRPLGAEGEGASDRRLYRRRVDSYRFEEVGGSQGLRAFSFAPDGQWIYFTVPAVGRSTDLRLMKAPLDGSGAAASVLPWDPSWDPTWWVPLASGDFIVGTQGGGAYVRVPANGAAPAPPVRFAMPGLRGIAYLWIALPGDRGAILNIDYYEKGRFQRGTACLDLKRGTTKLLLRDGRNAVYAPTGHLVFLRQSTLFAVPFDLNALETRGEPVAISEGVLEGSRFHVSRDGTLTYRHGGAFVRPRRLAVADRQGHVSDWAQGRMAYDGFPVVSPGGKRAAVMVLSARQLDEIWISERGGASSRRVVAMDGADCIWPVWSYDERQIAFYRKASDEDDGIYVQGVGGGAPRRICRSTEGSLILPTSWSPNGKFLLATVFGGTGALNTTEVVRVVIDSAGDSLSTPVRLFPGSANQGMAYFSPDGHWVAYHSNETGENEVYVAPFRPDGSLGTPLALGRGLNAQWSRSGREVFFNQGTDVAPRLRMASVSLRFTTPPSSSPPTPGWDLESLRMTAGWDILPGDQFLFVQMEEDESATEPTRIACVTNFFDELRRKVREAGK